ncbi:MAG: MBL fold metallo-hydrolase [Phycisphaerales bacterium]|nr:MBL fold metallo-hydrolase [Phycisphaerales bacterium]
MATCRVISIGTLARNLLWNESTAVRTAHATTTLIEADDACIIVDPSLPPQVMAARLHERAGKTPDDITHVFCTGFSDDHVGGIAAFTNAQWLCSETELANAADALDEDLGAAQDHPEDGGLEYMSTLKAIHDRMRVCPDALADGVDLFPLPGVRPGTAGLLLPQRSRTVLIAGDAVATSDHLLAGQVLPECFNREQALESFKEAIEIADVIVPGRDNIELNPLRHMPG